MIRRVRPRMLRRTSPWIAIALVATVPIGLERLQPQVAVLSEGRCPSCRIVSESIAYLGDLQDASSPRNILLPAVDSRGRLVAIEHGRLAVLVYDSRGRLLRTLEVP
jgi:hypothetical protein